MDVLIFLCNFTSLVVHKAMLKRVIEIINIIVGKNMNKMGIREEVFFSFFS